jgi:Uma2 family endonuclease
MPLLLDDEIRGLDQLPPDALYEVIDGEAKEIPPMGFNANLIAHRLYAAFARALQSPGDLVMIEGLFSLPAPVDRRRRPDLAYLPVGRIPTDWPSPSVEDPPAMDAVPAVAVEIVSPTDLALELDEKRTEYFAVGVATVVIVYPNVGAVHVYDSAAFSRVLTAADTLILGSILPRFSIPVADLFAPLNPPAQP